MKNEVIIFGDGLLGKQFHKQTKWDYISRKKDNIDFVNDFGKYLAVAKNYNIILNCIAFTKTYSEDKESNWKLNYEKVCDLVDWCNNNNKKLIHISTDYVYCDSVKFASENDLPIPCKTWYGHTKLLGDSYVQLRSKNYLLIRTSFKLHPFPYNEAINTQVGNFDYVNVIADIIVRLIKNNSKGLFNVGTHSKDVYELALMSKDVKESDKIIHPLMPTNITMNLEKLEKELGCKFQ